MIFTHSIEKEKSQEKRTYYNYVDTKQFYFLQVSSTFESKQPKFRGTAMIT